MENPPSSSASRTAWLIVALLFPVALLNYLDRQMLAAMKVSVMHDIPDIASQENWGFLLGAFKWVYAALSPVGGYLADRFSRRHVIAASLFVWSAVTWAMGHVTTYDQLLAARAFMGISEACYIPAALALIADFHTGATRSRAVGVHQMGIYAGVIIGGFTGYVADAPGLGWRVAFEVCGIAGVLYALPLVLLLKNAPRTAATVPPPSPGGALRELLGRRVGRDPTRTYHKDDRRAIGTRLRLDDIHGQGHAVLMSIDDVRQDIEFGLTLSSGQRGKANGQKQHRQN